MATNSSLVANPGSVAFGNVAVGSSSPQTITLKNNGQYERDHFGDQRNRHRVQRDRTIRLH